MKSLKTNLVVANDYLARFKSDPLCHFVGGQKIASDAKQCFVNHSPVDQRPLCEVPDGGGAIVDEAAKIAHEAFLEWRDVPGKKRREILNAVADGIEERAELLAVVESLDTGQPIKFMSKAALRGAQNFRFFADKAESARDGLSTPVDNQHLNFTTRMPLGVVGVITPWNTPFMLSTWKIAPALAAGCSVVHKPAEWSPLTASLLAEIAYEAGLPSGVLNCVHGLGETTGKALTQHELVRAVAFVGESQTGSMIQQQTAAGLKRLHLELGGKNPVIIFADADWERALDAVIFMIYSLNGERCTSSSRLLVEEPIYDKFTKAVAERAERIRVGHPLDPETEVGPLIHARHYEKVKSYFAHAEKEGAHCAAGGLVAADEADNLFVRPTIFTKATNTMRIAHEEIFGPVLTAIPFVDEADAIHMANDTPYGLAGYIWTRDIGRAHRVAQAVEAGMVWINSENTRHLPTPFGGMKASGLGRDGGNYSFDFYLETKNISVGLDNHQITKLGG